MKRAKRLLIKGKYLPSIIGVASLLVGFLSFSKPAHQSSPAVPSFGSGWVFEVVEKVDHELEDEVTFWKRLDLRRRFGEDMVIFLELAGGLTMDVAGDPDDSTICVVYYDPTNGDLKYAEQIMQDSVWIRLTLDSLGDVGKYPAIAIGRGGRRHVSYYDADKRHLKYMTCADSCTMATKWYGPDAVDESGVVGLFTEITVDPLNRPHISYIDSTNKSLKYARLRVGWEKTTVDSPNDLIASTSIGVAGGDSVHISYSDRTNKTLKYAYCTAECDESANWDKVTVPDPWSDVGLWNSIAVGVGDTVHISYSASDSLCDFKALKYAKGRP